MNLGLAVLLFAFSDFTISLGDQLLSDRCKVTLPNGIVAGSESTDESSYGNKLLSVYLWPDGTIVFKPGGPGFVTPDGELGMKFPWNQGARGWNHVTGRRLDGAAGPARRETKTPDDGIGVHPGNLIFPTAGCWEVVGQIDDREDSTLTFVTSVVKIGEGPTRLRSEAPSPIQRTAR
jgi:hypothetical protein